MKTKATQPTSASQSWEEICNQQGWNQESQIIHLEGFLRAKGLFEEFEAYAQAAANEENEECL